MNNRGASSILDGIRDAIAAATRSNASIYSVDPRGLTGIADEAIEAGIFADQRPRTAQDDPDATAGWTARYRHELASHGATAVAGQPQDSRRGDQRVCCRQHQRLRFRLRADCQRKQRVLRACLQSSVEQKRRQVSSHRSPDVPARSHHPCSSRLCRTQDERKGGSPAGERCLARFAESAQQRRAHERPEGASVSRRRSSAQARTRSVVMGVELRGGDLALADNQRLELAYVAVDASGETRVDTDAFTFKLPAETKARVKQTGIRFLKRLNIPAGRYHFRVGVHDTATGIDRHRELRPRCSGLPKAAAGDQRPARHVERGVLDGDRARGRRICRRS